MQAPCSCVSANLNFDKILFPQIIGRDHFGRIDNRQSMSYPRLEIAMFRLFLDVSRSALNLQADVVFC
jgi:hypothetical protein